MARVYNGRGCAPFVIFLPRWCYLTLLNLSFLSNFAKMKCTLVLAAIAVGVSAQCKSVGDIEKQIAANPNPNPLQQLDPKEAVFPCNFGAAVSLGKIPQGCGKLEFIYGLYLIIFTTKHGFTPS
jgi:hypothetical protein